MQDKETIRQYLLANKALLNISGIGRAAGIPKFSSWVHQYKDGHGNLPRLADRHLPKLQEVLEQITRYATVQ